MIGYRITKADLEKRIEAHVPGWVKRAASRTERFRLLGRYAEDQSIWTEVKAVYMTLQGGSKCAYCERKLESIELGKVEQDVEHFRPKGRIRAWKVPKPLKELGILASAAPAEDRGYFLLPYHVLNYAAACKPCNSALKKDYFPIAGTYELTGEDPSTLTGERPFLIFPIGEFDEAPENLIQFHGVSPQPVHAVEHGRERAIVTIEFFGLDDTERRKNLVRDRAVVIIAMYPQLEKSVILPAGPQRDEATAIADGFTRDNCAHANCARSFKKLFHTDAAEAKAIFNLAVRLVQTIS